MAPNQGDPQQNEETDRVTHWKGYQLSIFQIQAVAAVRSGANVLVSAPTGAGKTLVAEYAIEDAVRRGRRCIYTAPIKALSNQKYRDFRDDPSVDVGLMTGDVTIAPGAQVLIMTTEILRNAIFENPRGLDDIEYVVFDEVHYMDDVERGSVWEESLIFAPPSIRFICLSATIENIDQVGSWIREIRPHPLEVIRSEDRPVPLVHRFYRRRTGLFDIHRIKQVREREGGLAKSRKRKDKRSGRGPKFKRSDDIDDVAHLLDELSQKELLPALVFSFSRRDCERLANRNRHRHLLSDAEFDQMQALQRELVQLFQLDEGELKGEIFSLASAGIGYHHAGMLPAHKELVERMFTSGLLKLLFTTETFALGINMPARTVVFHSLKKFDGVSFDYLRTRDYLQMAGRAGRQGIDKEGLVVSYLGERDLMEAPVERILSGRSEPVESRFRLAYSSILHLLERLGRERLHEAWEKSFNQFQHRAKNEKARERNRRRQRRLLDSHLALLEDLNYIENSEQLTPRGHVACLIYGYELQITEMLFRGALENLPPTALAVIFVGLIHEERRRGNEVWVPAKMFGGVRRHISQMVAGLLRREARFKIPSPLKQPDWGLTPAVIAWSEGASFEDLQELTEAPAGDICRTLRMAVQLLRQVRRAIDSSWDLGHALDEAAAALNRSEVDARRQLELG